MADLLTRLSTALADRYRLDRELGRGGMATVYLAHDLKHDRSVALKVLHPELAATVGPERFQREIRTTARLQHPHILPVLDSGGAVGQLWYTMPYVEGESLRDRLRREGQLPIDVAVDLARQVALALGYAHRQGFVHRDLKPDNILLSDGQALVADFGIAKALSGAGETQLTETGMAVGTPQYMAPEQGSGGQVDGRSDVYSLGCVLYEMLAGEPPFTGSTPQAILAKRVLEPVPHVRTLRDTVPETLEQTLGRAMAKAPADRFSTADDFARALGALGPITSLSPPPSALSTGQSRTAGLWLRRHWSTAVFALGMGLVLALGVVVATHWQPAQANGGGAKRLAVLPFENLGDSADAYFAQGLAGEIRGKLSALPALQVIASTSSDQYRGTGKRLRQIAAELGVQYVLAGRVQWDKQTGSAGRVRVSPELVEATTGATLWGQSFNATMADVFQVQGEIADRVAEALNVALRASEPGTVVSKPTEDLRAYDYYLRGNEYSKRAEASGWSLIPKEFELAGQMYARAVAADPRFALAHAKLARVHLALYQSFTDVSPDRLRKAKASAEEAIRLAPDLPEAHLALGAYYAVGDADYQRALGEFELARAREPASVDLLASMANVWTLKGQFDSAATYWRHAAELDPRSPRTAQETGWTLLYTRSYPEAERYLERAAALAPDWIAPRITQGLLYLDWRGDSARTRQILRRALLDLGVQQAAQLPLHPLVHLTSDTVLAPALDRLPLEDFAGDTTFYYLWKGYWHSLRGRPDLAAVYSDSARARLEPLVRAQPSEHWQHLLLAIAYTGMSRKTDAVREARRSVAIADSLGSAYGRANARFQLAIINARFGDPDAAITQLGELMRIPSQYSENFFRVYPGFAALRGNQRFERLLNGS